MPRGFLGATYRDYVRREVERATADFLRRAAPVGEFALRHVAPALPGVGPAMMVANAVERSARSPPPRAVKPPPSRGTARPATRLRLPSDEQVVMAIVPRVAREAGSVVGVLNAAVNTAGGLVEAVPTIARVVIPSLDPRALAAKIEFGAALAGGVEKATRYVGEVMDDPSKLEADLRREWGEFRQDHDPTATPRAATVREESLRQFDIGRNRGELAWNVGTMVAGGGAVKAVRNIGKALTPRTVDYYLAGPWGPREAAKLASPYRGMGDHTLKRAIAKRHPLLLALSETPLFLRKPRGMDVGQAYEDHYLNDLDFHGTALFRKGGVVPWKGRELGLVKRGLLGRLWYGSTRPMKITVGSGLASGTIASEISDTDR